MDKLNKILDSDIYNAYMRKLSFYEKDREFCKHDENHFLEVSRIAYIKVLEDNLNFSKEVIYAIGFLHDIGRVLEYEGGIPHHIGSSIIAKEILTHSEFDDEEIKQILEGIEGHRISSNSILGNLICESDKLSRNCRNCNVIDKCYWDNNKKNIRIFY